MGKRSTFERNPRDYYPTPAAAVAPLLRHVEYGAAFVEPCAGNGALIRHLEAEGLSCVGQSDIEPQADWISRLDVFEGMPEGFNSADFIITNPPWDRAVLHRMIVRFSDLKPTWLLFDADWSHTRQAAPYLSRLRKIVSVGRLKWIEDSPFTGKDNCAWHLFDKPSATSCAMFFGRAA